MTSIVLGFWPGFWELMHRILFSHIFSVKLSERHNLLHQKSTPACMITFFPNMKVIHKYLQLLNPILWRLGPLGTKMFPYVF